MSTTAEMSQCCEILMEADSSSSTSSSPTKDKFCSGGKCGTPPEESGKPEQEIKESNAFEESDNVVNIEPKRRASAVFETLKPNVEKPRRHSVQVLKSEDSFRHRHRQPSSIKDIDSTQMFNSTMRESRYK